jgi:hypothetical protein
MSRLSDARVYWLIAGVCLVGAALSLLYPSTPTYDPWSWIIWGREIVHLDLHTTGGPSWKPLPVVFTTLFAPFGHAAPDMWLVVARAGYAMAVVMTAKLALRLVGRISVGGVFAAIVAVVGLLVSSQFVRDAALGNSEGLLVAFALLAFERHLDGRPRQAAVLGFFAALLRPEVWLFLGLYGLWLWFSDPGARRLLVVLAALILFLWFAPELWGSGHLFRSAERAQNARANSAKYTKCPFCTVLRKQSWPLVLTPIKIAALLGFAAALLAYRRARRRGALLVVGIAGISWFVLIALMTQAGFSGNPRYLILGAALVVALGGAGFGWLVDSAADRARVRFSPAVVAAGGALLAVALFAAMTPWTRPRARTSFNRLDHALRYQAELRQDLSAAIRDVGGAKALRTCPYPFTSTFQVPMVAWYLGDHTMKVGIAPAPGVHDPNYPAPAGVAFQTRSTTHAPLTPRGLVGYRLLAHARTFRIYAGPQCLPQLRAAA